MELPVVSDADQLAQLRGHVAPWRAGLDRIASSHAITGEPAAAANGTQPVFLYANAVVKLYAPPSLWHDQVVVATDHAVERATLHRLAEAAVLAPRIIGEGELHGWRYLVMSRIRGQPIERVLPSLSRHEAHEAMRRLGRAVAALHAVDARGLITAIDDFDAFLAAQERDIVAIEQRRGAPERWLQPLRDFVDATSRGNVRPVLLHTELGPGHALYQGQSLTGIIDWAETMAGDPEYDIAAVAFFIARGDGALLGAFLDGYGWAGPTGETLARRLLRHLLLHRYAPLSWLLDQRPVPTARDFDDLVVPWMGLA